MFSKNLSSGSPSVVFLFTSSRDEIISKVKDGKEADTPLRGLNYIPGAMFLVAHPTSVRSLKLLPRLLSYNFVITQDHLLLGFVASLCSRFLGFKTHWLYLAINSSILIRRHSSHPVRMYILKKFWSSYTRIICITTEQIENFVRLGIPRSQLVFMPFPIDVEFFKPKRILEESELIVSVGRDMGRDYPTLLKAAEFFNYKLVIAAAKKNIPPEIHIPQNVTVHYDFGSLEVRDLYFKARVVVVVSKDDKYAPDGSDCSGQTVILEALASGKAVIATSRSSWITDYLIPGKDLIVVPPNNPKSLTEAINLLWGDQEKRKSLGLSGQKKVLELYSTRTAAMSMLELMNSIK